MQIYEKNPHLDPKIKFPILLIDKETSRICLFTSETQFTLMMSDKGEALGQYTITKGTIFRDPWAVYHGTLCLSNEK